MTRLENQMHLAVKRGTFYQIFKRKWKGLGPQFGQVLDMNWL